MKKSEQTSVALALGSAVLAAAIIMRARRSSFSFSGKVCLITGGSRGLGLVLARQICAEGGKVVLLARDRDELRRAEAELTAAGGDVLTIPCDLLDSAQIRSAIAAAVDRYHRLDVVINNAGIIEVGPLQHMQQQDFERSMNLHFWAPYHVIMASLPHLREAPEPRIVNVASIGGRIAVPHLSPYSASKFALVGLSDSLRAELAQDGIRVTTVLPGMMQTGSHVNAQFKGDHAAEYAWFSASASLPLVALKAERAAAKILNACRRGKPTLMMPFSTRLAILGNAAFPDLSAQAMKLANRLLPAATDASGDALKSGHQSRGGSDRSWISRFGNRAAERNNESSSPESS